MNPSSSISTISSSSKTHNKQKCTPTLTPANSTIQRRKKQKNPRNPLKDLNSNNTTTTTNVSSSTSIEAPKGCLRFLLSHSSSSSSKTPFNRPLKTTPKSAPILSKRTVLDKPISQKPHKVNRNPPCLYQWQSGKKPSSKTGQKSKNSSVLDSNGSPVNKLCVVKIVNDRGNDDANLTPVTKIGTGSGLDCRVNDDKVVVVVDDEESNSSTSNTKTPPVQASVSPEIQCGSSLLSTNSATITTPTCYGAGYVLSGVTDKRKCRPRGILTVGGDNDLLGFGKAKDFNIIDDDDDDDDEENGNGVVNNSSAVSTLPLPAEASMHWLLSPCNEEDEDQKENSEIGSCRNRGLEGCATLHSPSLPSLGHGFSSDLCNDSDSKSISTNSNRRRRSASLFSPSQLPEFRGLLGSPNDNVVVSNSSHATTPSGEAASLKEERKYRYGLEGDNTPFSKDSLGSGNVMRTPQSDSSSDRCVGLSWLSAEDRTKHHFDSQLNSVAEDLQLARLSPKSHVSIWDPNNSSFQFDCLTTPSNSIDLSHFQKILDDQTSWLSNSTLENVSQSQMRISWREGLVSRIFEMDEFDSCRCISDEEEDVNGCCNEKLKFCQSPELNIDAEKDQNLTNGFGSTEFVDNEPRVDGKGEERLPPHIAFSCAESISTDGGGLIASGDSDWNLCYKNELFQV